MQILFVFFRFILSRCKLGGYLYFSLKVTVNCAEGCWCSCFNISKNITDIFLKQVTVQQHMNEILYSEGNKLLFKNAPTHSSQQLAAPLERFCAKLLGDCKEFGSWNFFFLHYFTVFTRLALEDIWHFMYTFSNICGNLTALGVRNVLRA